MEMTMAYREFYKMAMQTSHKEDIFEDVYMFITKGYPASASANTCIRQSTQDIDSLVKIMRVLMDNTILHQKEYQNQPTLITREAREIYALHIRPYKSVEPLLSRQAL